MRLRVLVAVAVGAAAAGCAGGWRNGPPPGSESAPAVAAATTAMPAAAKPAATPAGGKGPATTADGTTFVFRGEAKTVHLAGDFNAWSTSADPLEKQADGSWKIVKKLDPGSYEYKFALDGGATWKEDPNAAEFKSDPYGGKNSVVTVGAAGGAGSAPASMATAPVAVAVTGKPRAPFQDAAGVTFTCALPAKSVHLAGDFNDWSTTATPMKRQADGTWTVTVALRPGAHAYRFLVDGTSWKTDDANPDSQDDSLGGRNSVVTVK